VSRLGDKLRQALMPRLRRVANSPGVALSAFDQRPPAWLPPWPLNAHVIQARTVRCSVMPL